MYGNGEPKFRIMRAEDRDWQLWPFLAIVIGKLLVNVYQVYIFMLDNVDELLLCGPYIGI